MFANKSALSSGLLSERISDIEVAVVASDLGNPSLKAVAAVKIRVNNDKGFLPHFTQEEYQ